MASVTAAGDLSNPYLIPQSTSKGRSLKRRIIAGDGQSVR